MLSQEFLESSIRAKTARKFKVTTDSNHQEPIAPNLLEQDFSAEAPNMTCPH